LKNDLPTLFQWEKAARASMHTVFGVIFPWGLLDPRNVAQRANFESAGTAPVDSFPFGMSPYGVYNMAGNVA
jgi:formylglycine-generating enzyme required for sulfatase activity